MRRLGVYLFLLLSIGCSKAPGDDGPGDAVASASNVAFAYHYDFRLPSDRIANAQKADARACEALTAARCHITGMTYRLDQSGQLTASLDVAVAAPIARAFGRAGVQRIEAAGGALTGAEIVGTDRRSDRTAETAYAGTGRATGEAMASPTSVSTTPIGFVYTAGTGVGLRARVAEALHVGYVSLSWTITTALMLIAYLGSPLALLLLLAWLWHRVGRRALARLLGPRETS
ncbi:hypothetical protein [Sphingomonas montana]|uniref:hypothetical protein n=1 Tax=Sphingomonas montana TaxID=1843236 RepID=UPI00101AD467|nr:hypothetical protein [Sphingomonas montana]